MIQGWSQLILYLHPRSKFDIKDMKLGFGLYANVSDESRSDESRSIDFNSRTNVNDMKKY